MAVHLELIIAASIWLYVSVLVKFCSMAWIVTLVLSVTWDTAVSERLTVPIFMVNGGLYIPLK